MGTSVDERFDKSSARYDSRHAEVMEVLRDHGERLVRIETVQAVHGEQLVRIESAQVDHARRIAHLEGREEALSGA